MITYFLKTPKELIFLGFFETRVKICFFNCFFNCFFTCTFGVFLIWHFVHKYKVRHMLHFENAPDSKYATKAKQTIILCM